VLTTCWPSVDISNQHLSQEGEDVIQGLNKYQKTLPSQYFYDDRGSELFEQICELPEYYPTGTEAWILQQYYADEIAQITGACELVELGSGSSTQIRLSKIRRTKTQFTNYNGEYSALVNN
jgi:uncharacterized SAM-dependent methyltransferase